MSARQDQGRADPVERGAELLRRVALRPDIVARRAAADRDDLAPARPPERPEAHAHARPDRAGTRHDDPGGRPSRRKLTLAVTTPSASEARIDRHQVAQAAGEEQRSEQQHDRQRHLGDDQPAPQRRRLAARGRAAAVARITLLAPTRVAVQRRREAEQHAGQQRQSRR